MLNGLGLYVLLPVVREPKLIEDVYHFISDDPKHDGCLYVESLRQWIMDVLSFLPLCPTSGHLLIIHQYLRKKKRKHFRRRGEDGICLT